MIRVRVKDKKTLYEVTREIVESLNYERCINKKQCKWTKNFTPPTALDKAKKGAYIDEFRISNIKRKLIGIKNIGEMPKLLTKEEHENIL